MATFTVPARATKTKMDLDLTQNLVNSQWELIDPIPDIHMLFQKFNSRFFMGKLACVELEWSKRMYQCAGICYSRRNRVHMSCVIRLSEPLLKLRSRKELIETLLHEMIHAWNFIRHVHEENGGHGPQFLSKMSEINSIAGTNITVYHSFHDEVAVYKTHWWQCDGPCKDRKPYFGSVKRTSNRAPSERDLWWQEHQRTCGGTFIKIKEPEKKIKKKTEPKNKATTTKKLPETPKSNDIRKFFTPNDSPVKGAPSTSSSVTNKDSSFDNSLVINDIKKDVGNGNIVGGSGSGKSRLLDLFDNPSGAKKRKLNDDVPTISLLTPPLMMPNIKEEFDDNNIPTISILTPPSPKAIIPRKSVMPFIKEEFDDDDDDIIFIDDEFDDNFESPAAISNPSIKKDSEGTQEFCNCPVCNEKIKSDSVNQHLDECLTLSFLKQ